MRENRKSKTEKPIMTILKKLIGRKHHRKRKKEKHTIRKINIE